jgi:(4S)-4-hydroxy-5-phosphonooxypentane-2,3-dione isomerase
MVTVTVTLEIEPTRVDEFLRIMTENAAASRAEAGCLRFEISRAFDKPNAFALSEAYKDKAAMDAHYETAHYAVWKAAATTGIVLSRSAVKGDVISA